mgnify:FL=1
MKRVLKYTLVMFLAMFSFNLTAFAKETVIKIDSEKEFIKVGETVELNVNIDTEEKISEVTFEVESSDNIEIKAVTLGSSKYTKEETENKYNINFNDDLTGTNNIFDILIKANSFGDTGSGLVTIKNISYKKESKTVKLNDVTYSIDVQSNKIENIEDGKTDSEKERIAISNANVLVEAAERSNSKDDYESALAYVNTLTNETEKKAFLERLDKVRFNIEVNSKCQEMVDEQCKNQKPETEKNDSSVWIILSVTLMICVALESIYIITNLVKKKPF